MIAEHSEGRKAFRWIRKGKKVCIILPAFELNGLETS
jgi:hypothetical protein